MPEVHRLADRNEDDIAIVQVAQTTVFANNLLVSVDGSLLEDGAETANGSRGVFIENRPVNRRGDVDTDLSPRAMGSPDVFAGDVSAGTSGARANTGDTPVPVTGVSKEASTAAAINYGRFVADLMFRYGLVSDYGSLPYGGNDAFNPAIGSDTPVTVPQAKTAAFNWIESVLEVTNTQPYVPFSSTASTSMTDEKPALTPAVINAMDLSFTKKILDVAKAQGSFENSDRLPFVSKTSPGFEDTELDMSLQKNLDLNMNYFDSIVNTEPLLEMYPRWPRLPFGSNNGNT